MSNQLPIQSLQIKYAIGIDADLCKSGLAVYSRLQKRLTFVEAVTGWELLDYLNRVPVGEALFFIDAGWLNEGYHHYAGLPDDFGTWNEKAQRGYLVQCGCRVGENFGVGKFIVAYLKVMHGPDAVREIQPVTAKWSAADLKRYTGWSKRTNQDSRDACKLCFQR